jgi:hypothetical protein
VLNSYEQDSSSKPIHFVGKRRHARRPLHSLIRIACCSDPAQRAQLGQGIDIGYGGLAFESDSALDFYSVLQLEYRDDEGRDCNRKARLLYRMNRRYGAYFVDVEQTESPE